MSTNRSWKISLAVLLAATWLTLTALPEAARAEVEDTTVADPSILSGGETQVHVRLSPGGPVRISAHGRDPGTTAVLTLLGCTPNCALEEGESGEEVRVSLSNRQEVRLALTATCAVNDSVFVTASQSDGGVESDNSAVVECIGSNIKIVKTAPGAGSLEFNFTGSGTGANCSSVTFGLNNQESMDLACDRPGTYTITESATSGWGVLAIECEEQGEADAVVTLAERKVVVTLTADVDNDDAVVCTFINVRATPTVGAAATIEASASPGSVGCNATSFVLLTIRDGSANPVANGTTVNVSVSGGGSMDATTASTTSGGALILYTAPASGSGTATITATAGGAVGSTTVQYDCAASQATAVPPPPPPPPAAPPTGSTISPPNTGDAGLSR
jgi:hypothetical protein